MHLLLSFFWKIIYILIIEQIPADPGDVDTGDVDL